MQIFRWAIAIGFLIVAAWLSALNWSVFWKRHVQKLPASSWLPLIGGGLGAVGIAIIPVPNIAAWWWTALLLDWGCVPGIGYSIFYHLMRLRK